MPPAKRRVMAVQPHEVPPVQATPAPQRRIGRPPGEASTIVNVRLPLSLVAQLDDYLDRLEGQTGLKANRGMIARRALEILFGHPSGRGIAIRTCRATTRPRRARRTGAEASHTRTSPSPVRHCRT